MPKKSVLQFIYYSVEEIRFKDIPVDDNEKKFALHPKYKRELTELGENKYKYFLSVSIMPTEDDPAPFELYVAVVGHFALHEDEEDPIDDKIKETILKRNTAAILFPFLRSIVSTLTVNANIPALILPVLNFSEDELDENANP